MHTYKVEMANGEILEFESKHHLHMMQPEIIADGVCMVMFKDANVILNLANIDEIEIDGRKYRMQSYEVKR